MQLQIVTAIPELNPLVVQTQINLVYQRLLREYKWNFLKTHDFLSTFAPYSTGTVTVSNGSTAVAGAGTAFTTAGVAVGDYVRFGAAGVEKNFYEILTVTDNTNLVLSDAYVGSLTSGAAYSIFRTIYNLATDFSEFISIGHESPIHEVSSTYLNFDDPLRETSGKPTRYVMRGQTAGGVKKVEFYPNPAGKYLIYYDYMKTVSDMSADTDSSVIRDDVLLYASYVECYTVALPRNPAYAVLVPAMEVRAQSSLRSLIAQEVRLEPEEKQRWLERETPAMRAEGGR
jgi:hypothetical protein